MHNAAITITTMDAADVAFRTIAELEIARAKRRAGYEKKLAAVTADYEDADRDDLARQTEATKKLANFIATNPALFVTPHKTAFGKFGIRKMPDVAKVTDETAVKKSAIRLDLALVDVIEKINLAALLTALKDKRPVDGAKLESGRTKIEITVDKKLVDAAING